MPITKFLLTAPLLLILTCTVAKADHLDTYGILRDDSGAIVRRDHDFALKACPEGTHLPTVREQAMESRSQGAKGILEISQVGPGPLSDRYYKISAINPDGAKDEFYFAYDGYQPPAVHDLACWFYWSSSVSSDNPLMSYGLNTSDGILQFDQNTSTGFYAPAIRCLKNRGGKR